MPGCLRRPRFWIMLLLLFVASGCGNEISEATKQLQNEDPLLRQQGARKLAETDNDATASIPQLIASLKDPNADVRRLSARALGQMGSSANAAVPSLVKLLQDNEANVRTVAALALVNIAPENDAPVELLSQSAGAGDPRAIIALGQLGPTATKAVPALIRGLQSGNSLVKLQAIRALEKIGPAAKAALSALSSAAQSPDEDIREAARQAKATIDKP